MLAETLDATQFLALTICRTSDGWQASLNTEGSSFRIRHGSTPSEALCALFAPTPSNLPPLPY